MERRTENEIVQRERQMEETVHKRISEKAARLENEDFNRKRDVEELIARRVREERERLERDFGE